MGRIIALAAVALVLFAASAGVSWYLRQSYPGHTTEANGGEPTAKAPAKSPAGPAAGAGLAPAGEMRPAVRPQYNPEAEGAVQLATNLSRQMEALRTREQQFAARQKSLEMIYLDIRGERAMLDELRKQVAQEAKAVDDRLAVVERRAGEVAQQKQDATDQVKEMKKTMTEFEGVEGERIRQMAAMYDVMAPENAAKILQQMADTGSIDTAVKVLASMKERQAARVLAELPDPNAAAQLLERMKGLKRPAGPAAGGTARPAGATGTTPRQ